MRNPKDITINGKQLSEILEAHRKWLYSEEGGERADLSNADLRSADLSNADLRSANLRSADLRSADLSNADLRSANLSNAKNIEQADAITRIIPDGDIIGWKKCNEGIVKLIIPAKAKRSNATGRKCRAEYAIDKGHFDFDGKRTRKDFTSTYDSSFVYKVGGTIKPNEWDENRWAECSSGVHFFITRYEAENYNS